MITEGGFDMLKGVPPEWAINAKARMFRLRITGRDLAKMLGIHNSLVSNTMSGYLANRPDLKEKILAKLDELENEGVE